MLKRFTRSGIAILAPLALAFSVAACKPADTDKQTHTHQTTVQEQVVEPKTQTDDYDDGPGLCVGACVGPHINLNNGQLEVFSTGPGLSF